jgi:hypothetical protein
MKAGPFPSPILLALPLGVIGGVVASMLRGFPNDVYFQIGLLTVLGLTTKNAILIVQFAMAKNAGGDGADRGDAGSGQIKAAPHRHDLPGLRLRRPAPGFGHGAPAPARKPPSAPACWAGNGDRHLFGDQEAFSIPLFMMSTGICGWRP